MKPGTKPRSDKFSQYSNTEVQTANRLRLLIMLYDGAIRFIDVAKDRIEAGDTAAKGTYIGKAMSIVGEFKNTLNFSVAGDVPHQLQRLYQFVEDRLIKANLHNDTKMLDEARRILDTLRGAWVDLERQGVGNDPVLAGGGASEGKENYITINV